jgi:hypothetical protein
MANPTVAPYGSWKSPITSDLIVAETIGLGGVCIDGGDTYWLEMRPRESGRYVLVRRGADGGTLDATAAPFNARTRVHEYGGGSVVINGGTVWFSNFNDQRLYRQDLREGRQAPHPYLPSPSCAMRTAFLTRCCLGTFKRPCAGADGRPPEVPR